MPFFKKTLLISFFLPVIACNSATKNETAIARSAIIRAEKEFEQMVREKGIAEGFAFFADSFAVIKREKDSLIFGRAAIRNYYANPAFKSASVSWAPDFTAVANSADFGYTYGRYTWSITDSNGVQSQQQGVFHTVWKKQLDGAWRYVWD